MNNKWELILGQMPCIYDFKKSQSKTLLWHNVYSGLLHT